MTEPKRKPARKAAAPAVNSGAGPDLVARVSAAVTTAAFDRMDIRDVNDLGHPNDEEIRSLAHIYTPWGDARSNGSGIVARAAWAKRLEEEGIASADGRDLTTYIRGLIHR